MKKFYETASIYLENPEEAMGEEPVAQQTTLQPEAQPLSPESEVMLVRLIKRALVTKIETSDYDAIGELNEINSENAKESLDILVNLMNKYSSQQ